MSVEAMWELDGICDCEGKKSEEWNRRVKEYVLLV